MVDRAATESPESRLLGAGFSRRLEWWVPPGEDRALSLTDALAALDAGQTKPRHIDWPGADAERFPGFRAQTEEEIDRLLRPPPPPLPDWLDQLAELVAEKLRPVGRADVRAALRAEARKQTRERAA